MLEDTGKRIQKLRKEKGWTLEQLGNEVGVNKSTVRKWETGMIKNMRQNKLADLAKALNTTPAYLMGWDDAPFDYEDWLENSGQIIPDEFRPDLDPDARTKAFYQFKQAEELDQEIESRFDGLTGAPAYLNTATVQIPVLGSVPAGVPLEAVQDIDGFIDIPMEWQRHGKYIALKVTGSSMYPKYLEGDIVVLKLQDYANSHQDAVVYVNGYDATLKTVTHEADGSTTLTPINPEYETKNYPDGMVKVLGVVKRQIREF